MISYNVLKPWQTKLLDTCDVGEYRVLYGINRDAHKLGLDSTIIQKERIPILRFMSANSGMDTGVAIHRHYVENLQGIPGRKY